jgi:hypothetical protein
MYLNKVVTDFGGSNRIILEIDWKELLI